MFHKFALFFHQTIVKSHFDLSRISLRVFASSRWRGIVSTDVLTHHRNKRIIAVPDDMSCVVAWWDGIR